MTAQRQDSVRDQMRDVVGMATEAGCYDAADWIRSRWPVRPCVLAPRAPGKARPTCSRGTRGCGFDHSEDDL